MINNRVMLIHKNFTFILKTHIRHEYFLLSQVAVCEHLLFINVNKATQQQLYYSSKYTIIQTRSINQEQRRGSGFKSNNSSVSEHRSIPSKSSSEPSISM